MTINNLCFQHRAPVSGQFRVRRPARKIATNGAHYLSFTIEDYSGELRAVSWDVNIVGGEDLKEFDCVTLNGRLRTLNGNWLVDVNSAERLQEEPENPVHLIPRSTAPVPVLLDELETLYNCFSHPALKSFVGWVLTDAAISFPFVALPASRQHHHNTAGGLLDHSLECASMVSRYYEFPEMEIQVGMIAALFHDIGKIRTIQSVGKHSVAGYVLDHDALTLEILAPHLQRLDASCPDAGVALRYLLTWRCQRKNFHPLLTIAEAISAADHISSGLDRQRSAFEKCPDWHSFAKIGENTTFWRPRLEQSQGNVA